MRYVLELIADCGTSEDSDSVPEGETDGSLVHSRSSNRLPICHQGVNVEFLAQGLYSPACNSR